MRAPTDSTGDPDGKIVATSSCRNPPRPVRTRSCRRLRRSLRSRSCSDAETGDERSEGVAEQAARRAVDDVDCARIGRAAHTLAGHADCEVVVRVAVEIARGQGGTKSRRPPRRIVDRGGSLIAVLVPERSRVGLQTGRRPIQHIDGTGVRDGTLKHRDVLADHAHGQVVETITVEIARGQRKAEQIEVLGNVPHDRPGCSASRSGCWRWTPRSRCRTAR